MSDESGQRNNTLTPIRAARRLLGDTAARWRGRLDMLRGLFVKDPVEQLDRIGALLRHFEVYRNVDRALFYHRFAANLFLAHRLGIFEVLDEQPISADEVAEHCGIRTEAAENLLRILHAQKLVERTDGNYCASSFAREFLTADSSLSLNPMLDIGTCYAEAFPAMIEGATTGEVPDSLDIFEDNADVDALLDGVNAYLDQAGRELIARVELPEIRHLIVGSMGVSFSSLILSTFCDARVTYGCLPHLVERIPRLRREYDVDPARVVETHPHGGEPSEDQWGRERFDLVFLTKKMVLDPGNDLGDKFARKSLEVLNPGGVTIFWETVHEERRPTPIARALEGFLDFGVSPAAPVLTRDRFRNRLRDIGFEDVRFVSCLNETTTFTIARAPG